MILHGTFNFRQSLYSYSTESVVLRKKTINKKKIHKEPKDKQYEVVKLGSIHSDPDYQRAVSSFFEAILHSTLYDQHKNMSQREMKQIFEMD